jgi:hypothetical protein
MGLHVKIIPTLPPPVLLKKQVHLPKRKQSQCPRVGAPGNFVSTSQCVTAAPIEVTKIAAEGKGMVET